MEQYKPGYLGKVLPVDDPSKLTAFVTDKYDAFSKVYDTCKDQSSNITDIKVVETGNDDSSSLSIKISTDQETMAAIEKNAKGDESVTVSNDVVTAKS